MENVLMLLIVLVTSPLIYHRLQDMKQYPEKYLEGETFVLLPGALPTPVE